MVILLSLLVFVLCVATTVNSFFILGLCIELHQLKERKDRGGPAPVFTSPKQCERTSGHEALN